MLNRSPKALTDTIVDQIEGDLYDIEVDKERVEKLLSRWRVSIQKTLVDATCGFKIKAFFDGGSTPNPGQMKIGGYIEEAKGKLIYEYSKDIGYGTNNEAEYSSLLHLCKALVDNQVLTVRIYGDSSLVVNQVNGVYKAKHVKMVQLRDEVQEVLKGINDWELIHIPRKQNKRADFLT